MSLLYAWLRSGLRIPCFGFLTFLLIQCSSESAPTPPANETSHESSHENTHESSQRTSQEVFISELVKKLVLARQELIDFARKQNPALLTTDLEINVGWMLVGINSLPALKQSIHFSKTGNANELFFTLDSAGQNLSSLGKPLPLTHLMPFGGGSLAFLEPSDSSILIQSAIRALLEKLFPGEPSLRYTLVPPSTFSQAFSLDSPLLFSKLQDHLKELEFQFYEKSLEFFFIEPANALIQATQNFKNDPKKLSHLIRVGFVDTGCYAARMEKLKATYQSLLLGEGFDPALFRGKAWLQIGDQLLQRAYQDFRSTRGGSKIPASSLKSWVMDAIDTHKIQPSAHVTEGVFIYEPEIDKAMKQWKDSAVAEEEIDYEK